MDVWSSVPLTLAIGFLGLLSALILRHVTYWRFKGIPSEEGVPLIGFFSNVLFRKKSFPDVTMDAYKAQPGARYYGAMEFATPFLILKDPEIVKDIAVKNFASFPNHRSFVPEDFDPLMAKNLFSLKDERWREMRTVLTPAFTANKMKFLFQLVSRCSMGFVEYIIEHPEMPREIDLKDVYTRYTNDVIATSAFGISVNSLRERDNDFYTNGRAATRFEGFAMLLKMILGRIMPRFMRSIGLTFLPRRADRFFKRLIRETIRTRSEKRIERPDMIHLLMRARDNESGGGGIEMTDDDIVAQAILFFLAGFDTTARLMCFVSHVLSHHADVQNRLREEIEEIEEIEASLPSERGLLTYETLSRMRYLDMILSETLRLYPPQPFTDRVCVKPYTLPSPLSAGHHSPNGFTVPSSMFLWIPILGFHHDPNYFPDPEKFDPERFSEERKNDIKPGTYMPFGIGPRKCIGDRFALMETKILIVHLLRHFVFKPSERTPKIVKYSKTGTMMEPENGFWMRLEDRRQDTS